MKPKLESQDIKPKLEPDQPIASGSGSNQADDDLERQLQQSQADVVRLQAALEARRNGRNHVKRENEDTKPRIPNKRHKLDEKGSVDLTEDTEEEEQESEGKGKSKQ